MRTRVLSAGTPGAIEEAALVLRDGGLVVFPTDTVYGVGAHPTIEMAVEALYRVKQRPRDKAIPLLLANRDGIRAVAHHVPEIAWRAAERFWPGGLTIVLLKASHLPRILCAGGETIAVRVPDHPVALALIAAAGGAVAATSANLSGEPPAMTAGEAERALGGKVELILGGGRVPTGVPSTVLDLTRTPPRILREGAIASEEIGAFLAQMAAC